MHRDDKPAITMTRDRSAGRQVISRKKGTMHKINCAMHQQSQARDNTKELVNIMSSLDNTLIMACKTRQRRIRIARTSIELSKGLVYTRIFPHKRNAMFYINKTKDGAQNILNSLHVSAKKGKTRG
mgnify:CR=1 FL=1